MPLAIGLCYLISYIAQGAFFLVSIDNTAFNSERDFRKTQQKTPNNIENSLQMIA